MIRKISDIIADVLVENNITQVFAVPGGGSMHINDSLGHDVRINSIYHHHEQACAMAAEAYGRMKNAPAAVTVTTGPGATNAITGVLCAWMESIPMVIISGQARYATTVRASGLNLRSMGNQECDIVKCVSSITKYAIMTIKPEEVIYHLERGIYLATQGRKGPVWIDIPLDVQAAKVDADKIKRYDPKEDESELPAPIPDGTIDIIIEKIKKAKRPVIFAGAGIRWAGAVDEFEKLVDMLGVPVVNGMSSVDIIYHDHPLFVGRSSATGSRAGNFALQNADVLLSIGSRQSFAQTGFAYEDWAREAFTIVNDIDPEELKKENLHVSLPVAGDAKELIGKLISRLEGNVKESSAIGRDVSVKVVFNGKDWLDRCRMWKEKYPVVTEEEKGTQPDGLGNIYYFFDCLSKTLDEGANVAVSCGTSRVSGTQAFRLKKNQRFITNSATASMGYGLPAAEGISIATGKGTVVLVTGEGSFMMNMQELQTIETNDLPVKIFYINNQGYHSIRQTEKNFFGEPLIAVGPETGDLGFPDMKKLAHVFGFDYDICRSNEEMKDFVERVSHSGARRGIYEIKVSPLQSTMPKTATRKLDNGQMVSTPLEDMAPFLSRDELRENMLIPLTEEEERQ